MIIAVSDLHLGSEACNKDEFMRFLKDPMWANDRELVLCGDIFDFWRRSIVDVLIENSDVIDGLQYMYDELGVRITVIAGNHDWILRNVKHPCFKFSTFHQVVEGSTKYTFIHGWETDPIQKRELFDALCYTNNRGGEFLDRAWKAYMRFSGLWLYVPGWIRKTRTMIEMRKMLIPPEQRSLGFLFSPPLPVACEMEGDVTVCGHTHVPYIQNSVINCGCWCSATNTYAMITGNIATVQEFK